MEIYNMTRFVSKEAYEKYKAEHPEEFQNTSVAPNTLKDIKHLAVVLPQAVQNAQMGNYEVGNTVIQVTKERGVPSKTVAHIHGKEEANETFFSNPGFANNYDKLVLHGRTGNDTYDFRHHTGLEYHIHEETVLGDVNNINFSVSLGDAPATVEFASDKGADMVALKLFGDGTTVYFRFGEIQNINSRLSTVENTNPFLTLKKGDEGLGYYTKDGKLALGAPKGFDAKGFLAS